MEIPVQHDSCVLEKQRRDLIATPGYDRPLLMGYTTAINRIRGHDKPITHIDEAVAVLKNVVRSVVGRVVIYLQTGQTNMPDDEEMRKTDMMTNAVRVLSRIVGIGRQKTAMELASKGCYTVEQLREPQFYKMLQKRSQTALDWQDVVDAEASEEQAEAVAQFIRDNISSKFETVLVGSHRRNQTSKIINILLFHPGHVHIPTPSDNVFTVFKKPTRGNTSEGRIIMAPNVLQPLRDRGLIVGEMSQGVRLWTGIVRVPKREGVDVWEGRWARLNAIQAREGVYRRVEISYVSFIPVTTLVECCSEFCGDYRMAPWKSRGAALLGSTGDRKFIMDMRYSAEKLGMRLDEFGLWRWIEDPNDAIASHPSTSALTNAELPLPGGKSKGYWVLVAGETEESIFEELNPAI
ncbi:hypothetical protein EUX98_g7371 [Antrodiella citrinella]|uniref:DNA polymerase beta thumb domain-containing protein n=1 Tax=Antrodiella citrinella TaxID=2447956 RepID=A0A4S4MLQ9_9APHY|nr:hypothetical protein EUX98_g7371 [Antrodiella citrinella]